MEEHVIHLKRANQRLSDILNELEEKNVYLPAAVEEDSSSTRHSQSKGHEKSNKTKREWTEKENGTVVWRSKNKGVVAICRMIIKTAVSILDYRLQKYGRKTDLRFCFRFCKEEENEQMGTNHSTNAGL